MILFPRPRIPFVIALALAIPTWGISVVVFYFLFKRPYDSKGLSAIFAAAKTSMRTRRAGTVFNINRAAIERVFSKFGDMEAELKYSGGVPFVRWGVITHPMLNGGRQFTLRVDREGGVANVEASSGEAWWLLTERVWLGRRGTAPGIPSSLPISADESAATKEMTEPEDTAIGLFIMELGSNKGDVELPSLKYGRIADFVSRHELGCEYFSGYRGLYFFVILHNRTYRGDVTNLEPEKKDEGSVRVSARICH